MLLEMAMTTLNGTRRRNKMTLSELCQFLENNIEKPGPDDDPEVRAAKLAKPLSALEEIPIPSEVPGHIGVAFVIEDPSMPLVKILQKAKSVIEVGNIPVLLTLCNAIMDDCCNDCDCSEDLIEVKTPVEFLSPMKFKEPITGMKVFSEEPPLLFAEVADLQKDFTERLAEKTEDD
jgi:hypothetical protein